MNNSTLSTSIKSKTAKIGIIGLGYVGLPLAIRFAEERFTTIGIDINKTKIEKLNKGQSYFKHIKNDNIILAMESKLRVTNDFSEISNLDIIIICVPTPLGIHKEPDLSYIKGTLTTIKPYLSENQLLVLESTTYPGTTEEEIVPFIENCGYHVGSNFFVGYSPEREDPGNKYYTIKTIPKIVSGYTKSCLELTNALYSEVVNKTIPVSSLKVAEMAKILENIHRAVNIGLVNELQLVADKMDIDIYEVINAAATKPFGFTPYYPGPGLGGHCLPIDPFYLSWKAKQVGVNTRFIKLAGEINAAMPGVVIQKVSRALNDVGKVIKSSKILVLGLAYKKNIDDTRESPSLKIIELLVGYKALVDYSDPYIPKMPKTQRLNFDFTSVNLSPSKISSFDLVIISTDHDSFDYNMIQKNAKIIIDTRGRLNNNTHKA